MLLSPLSAAEVCTRCLLRAPRWQPRNFTRNVSRTSAINRGIRASQDNRGNSGRNASPPSRARNDRHKERRLAAETDAFAAEEKTSPPFNAKNAQLSKSRGYAEPKHSRRTSGTPKEDRRSHHERNDQGVSRGNRNTMRHGLTASGKDSAGVAETKSRSKQQQDEQQTKQKDGVPVAVPYSTAASQFLYGQNAVEAALRGKRRQFHQLLVKRQEGNFTDRNQLLRLAREANIPVRNADSRLLEKLSEGRPHNGVALEASALPTPSVTQFGRPNVNTSDVPVMAHGASPDLLKYNGDDWRQPFVLFLDGITDPGNVGGIIRTAHFYGVDAIIVAVNTCANINSPVMAKASAGACEALPIFETSRPSDFIFKSAQAGWRVCAAVAPDTRSGKLYKQSTSASLALKSPLSRNPCILMLGSEGEGLRENLRSKADLEVTIERGTPSREYINVGVDSINVGVAAGILIDAFMRKPNDMRKPKGGSVDDNDSNRIFRLGRTGSG